MRGFFSKGGDNVRGNTNRITQSGNNNTMNINGSRVIVNGVDVTQRVNANTIHGDGIAKTISAEPQAFDRINASAMVCVDFIIADTSSIEITADSNLVDFIDLSYFGGTLDIGLNDNTCFTTQIPMKVVITHPHLKAVEVSGAANIEVMKLKNTDFEAAVSGAGSIEIWGQADNTTLKVSGSGNVDATGLQVKDLRVKVSGMGDVKAYATAAAVINVSGMGNVTIFGNPNDKQTKCSGMGDIRFV